MRPLKLTGVDGVGLQLTEIDKRRATNPSAW